MMSTLVSSTCQAEIYKWVDAKGQTHYSERKADANGARTSEVSIPSAPTPSTTSTPSTEYLRTPNKFPAPIQTMPPQQQQGAASPKGPPLLSDGKDHGTDASRCALARDVLSGAVVHTNGKATDKYDREVARNDVKAFCKGR